MRTNDKEIKKMARDLIELLDNRDLIRNTERDNDTGYFIRQGVKIRNALVTLKKIADE